MTLRERGVTLGQWVVLGSLVGVLAGLASALFLWLLDLATSARESDERIVYLLPIAMDRLQRKLQRELAPGTRVVSHEYPFPSWTAQRIVALDVPEKSDYTGRRSTALYLYVVPPRS